MRRQIIIHLGHSRHGGFDREQQVSWIVLDAETPNATVFQGDLHTASNHAVGCRVIVFVSALDVLLTTVDLPAMNRQRLLKAVPFALEEQLASDVEELHFALGEREENTGLACAVVERSTTDDWLNLLKESSIQADVLTTEFFGVKHDEDSWTIVVDNMSGDQNKVVLRTGEQTGMAIEIPNLLIILRILLESTEPEQRPNIIRFVTCDAPVRTQCLVSDTEASLVKVDTQDKQNTFLEAQQARNTEELNRLVEQLGLLCDEFLMELEVQHQDDAYLAYLSRRFEDKACINLLQGEYSRIERLGKIFKPWIAPAAIASLWLLLQAGLFLTDYFELSAKDKALRAEIESIYRDAFPEAKNIVNPKVQMERALQELRSGGDKQEDIFPLLGKVGLVLSKTDGLTLNSIRYKSQKLDIDFEIKDLQSLDGLKLNLTTDTGLKVEIVSASAREGVVESRIQVQADK